MRALLTRLPALVVALLVVGPLAAQRGPDPREAAAQADILALADNLDDPDAAIVAQNIVLAHASEDISSVFAFKERGGVGIGALARAHPRNSIDRLLGDYVRKAPSRQELETYQADLDRTARVILAMSELAPHRNPYAGTPNRKQSQEWLRVSAEFKLRATEFRAAVACKDPEQVRKAAGTLHNMCCDCHSLIP